MMHLRQSALLKYYISQNVYKTNYKKNIKLLIVYGMSYILIFHRPRGYSLLITQQIEVETL